VLRKTGCRRSATTGTGTGTSTDPQVEGRSVSQEHSCAEAEGAPIAGHAVWHHEFLIEGSSSGEAYACSVCKAQQSGAAAEARQLRAGGGTAATAVEEDGETKREDARGMAKRPDLNELDGPEWAKLVLHK
jgi:hypothetical protein